MTNQFSIAPGALLAVYCLLILGASLAGGVLPMWLRLTHTRLQLATSVVAGLMLGVGLLHMFPHAADHLQSVHRAAMWMLAGFLVMFFVQRFFHFHHHDVPEGDPTLCCAEGEAGGAQAGRGEDSRDHHHNCEHGHAHGHQPHDHTLADKSARQLSWLGAGLGLALHTVVNGIALAASVTAESHAGAQSALAGLGTFLVIFFHKPFDAMVITTLMTKGGWSKVARHIVNALFALVIPLGVLLFYVGASRHTEGNPVFIGSALAFAAGTFLCIACSDLLPELQFHSHDRWKLSIAMLAGVGLAVLIGQFESAGHQHPDEHGHGSETATQPAALEHDH